MSSPAATTAPGSDETFKKGLVALDRRSYQQAAALFQEAIELERVEGSKSPRMKYISFLGLAHTLTGGRSEEGLKLCLKAVRRDFFDPDIYCNLGIVYLRHRQKAAAFEAFQKGLNLSPRNKRIRDELERYERRCDPVFTFLPRVHLINRMFGALRHRFRMLIASTNQEI